jgi:DNA polymerase III psi subunit
MNTELRAYYLDAFGVPDFLYAQPVDSQESATQKVATECLVIETQNAHSFSQVGEVQNFLFKMLQAIGLEKSNIRCLTIEAADLKHTLVQYDAKTVLLMSEDLTSNAQAHFSTHHPSEILSNENFKREAWEMLKQLKLCLK